MNVAFLGLGNYGKAIASLIEHNGGTYDYAEATEGRLLSSIADILFITVPTQYVHQALEANAAYVTPDTIIVNCSKGIEEGSHRLVHQIVRDFGSFHNYMSLIGPSFAEGIQEKEPTVVSLGYKGDDIAAQHIQSLIETDYFKVQPTQGYRALELASALKNVYAITCGYAEGLGFGANTQTRIIMTALDEFRMLAKAMHFASYDLTAPGVIGDLLLTCMSGQSRNYQYGLSLASDKIESIDPAKVTVEGYYTSHSIKFITQQKNVSLPLATLTSDIIADKVSGRAAFVDYIAKI